MLGDALLAGYVGATAFAVNRELLQHHMPLSARVAGLIRPVPGACTLCDHQRRPGAGAQAQRSLIATRSFAGMHAGC